MFNEHAVAQRVIEAVCSLTWPGDRLSVQVLDDSTDEHTKKLVEGVCARMRAIGVDCSVRHRVDRRGYKAGALEEGRQATNAELLVIFDADFVPPQDYLLRTIPHFYRSDGQLDSGLALVQAQWGHLNYAESLLTQAQSLWVDDHHTLQMSWRSAKWRFVNFTGTAGVWRAEAIEATASLVCEPEVLICDEITSALDVSVQAAIVRLLEELQEERGLALVFVTHNLALVRTIADRITVLNRGANCGERPGRPSFGRTARRLHPVAHGKHAVVGLRLVASDRSRTSAGSGSFVCRTIWD